MNGEKVFGPIADFRPADIPYGKGGEFTLFLIPGKITAGIARALVAKYAKPTTAEEASRAAKLGGIAGLGLNSLLAYIFKRPFMRKILGETASEGLSVATITAGFEKLYAALALKRREVDLSDTVAEAAISKVLKAIGAEEIAAMPPATETPATSSTQLGGFPERASSAFTGEEEYGGPQQLGAPEEDPVQRMEEILSQKSKV